MYGIYPNYYIDENISDRSGSCILEQDQPSVRYWKEFARRTWRSQSGMDSSPSYNAKLYILFLLYQYIGIAVSHPTERITYIYFSSHRVFWVAEKNKGIRNDTHTYTVQYTSLNTISEHFFLSFFVVCCSVHVDIFPREIWQYFIGVLHRCLLWRIGAFYGYFCFSRCKTICASLGGWRTLLQLSIC